MHLPPSTENPSCKLHQTSNSIKFLRIRSSTHSSTPDPLCCGPGKARAWSCGPLDDSAEPVLSIRVFFPKQRLPKSDGLQPSNLTAMASNLEAIPEATL